MIPNKISSIVGEIYELYVALNHRITFCVNDLVKEQWINVWSIELFSPQKQHSSSVFIPYLNRSLFVTTILCINLNWNSFRCVSSFAKFRVVLNIFAQCSSFKDSISLHLLGPVWPPLWVSSGMFCTATATLSDRFIWLPQQDQGSQLSPALVELS